MTSAAAVLPAAPAASSSGSPSLSVGSVLWRIALLLFVAFAALGALAVWSFWPRGDTRALRQAVFAAMPGEWHPQFQFRLGAPVCGLAQGVACFAPLPEEARDAIGAVESVEVSLAQAHGPLAPERCRAALAGARTAMLARGWEPTVLVQDGRDTVAVFTRSGGVLNKHLRICTLVLDGDQLVIANAELDGAPLTALVGKAMTEARRHAGR